MDSYVPEELGQISEQVRQGQRPSVTVRTLLSWFHAQRRGNWIVQEMRNTLDRLGLDTVPNFEWAYIDGRISFALKESKEEASDAAGNGESQIASGPAIAVADGMATADSFATRITLDPTYRVGKLASANRPPTSVTPDATVQEAVTLMLANDFSQLPVMTSDREVKGMISWKSLGGRLSLGQPCQLVRDCMDRYQEIEADESLFRAIDLIVQYECVLVRDTERKICGIVTTNDLSFQFRQLAEPFLLLGEIENHIRRVIDKRFSKEELRPLRYPRDVVREVSDVADLGFGEYLRLFESAERWEKLGLRIDRRTFVKDLENIRRIRNDVMNFDHDGLAEDDLETLRKFVQFLRRLQELRSR